MKKVPFGAKPSTPSSRASADAWVLDRDPGEPTKRLTVDVPLTLHKRVKTQCAVQGLIMAEVVRELLEQRFGTGEGAAADTTTQNAASS